MSFVSQLFVNAMPEMKKSVLFSVFSRFFAISVIVLPLSGHPAMAQQQGAAMPPRVSEQDLYRVDGVRVDITGNPVTARDKAVEQAQLQAYHTLLGRLTVAGPAKGDPDPSAMAKIVQDIDIVNEKISANHYTAIFDIRFRPDASRAWMSGENLAIAESARAPMIVVPIMVDGDRKKLWDVDNAWRDAWNRTGKGDPLLPVIMPAGDVADITLGTADEIMAGKPEIIEAYRQKYHADSVLVVAASLRQTDNRLGIEVRDFSNVHNQGGDAAGVQPSVADRQNLTLLPLKDEAQPAFYDRAVTAVLDRVRSEWKQQTAVNLDAGESSLLVNVPVRGIEDWIAIQRRLESQKNVVRSDIQALNPKSVRLILHHLGTIDQLRVVLGQYGLELAPVPGKEQAVLTPQAGTMPSPVAGVTAPPFNPMAPPKAVASLPDAPGATVTPSLANEPVWQLIMRDHAL